MLVDLHAIVRHTLDAKDPHPHQINISQLSMPINIANYQHLKFLQRIIWLRHGPRSQLVIKLHCNLRSHKLHHYLLQYQLRSFLDNGLLLLIPTLHREAWKLQKRWNTCMCTSNCRTSGSSR